MKLEGQFQSSPSTEHAASLCIRPVGSLPIGANIDMLRVFAEVESETAVKASRNVGRLLVWTVAMVGCRGDSMR